MVIRPATLDAVPALVTMGGGPRAGMTARRLPRAEWDRLAGTELAPVVAAALTRGCEAEVLVVDDAAGAIIGCWGLFQVWHAEGIWIAPAHRGRGAVARRLLAAAAGLARGLGITHVFTASRSGTMTRMLERLQAQPLEGAHYLLPLTRSKEAPCPRP